MGTNERKTKQSRIETSLKASPRPCASHRSKKTLPATGNQERGKGSPGRTLLTGMRTRLTGNSGGRTIGLKKRASGSYVAGKPRARSRGLGAKKSQTQSGKKAKKRAAPLCRRGRAATASSKKNTDEFGRRWQRASALVREESIKTWQAAESHENRVRAVHPVPTPKKEMDRNDQPADAGRAGERTGAEGAKRTSARREAKGKRAGSGCGPGPKENVAGLRGRAGEKGGGGGSKQKS